MLLTGSSLWAQQAAFTADVRSGCFPLTVRFTDTSTGNITGWSWDLGNGNQSTEQNPAAVYVNPGTYTIRLTVTGGSSNTETKIGYIVVHNKPTVKFTFDKTQGCSPLPVKFTDQSLAGSGVITEWSWVFGDGGSSTQKSPSYTYQTSGTKNISLRVKNEFGCEETGVALSAINVQGPNTNFTVDNTIFCQVPALAKFTNTSTGDAPLTYTWNFGDGGSSTQKDPSHEFKTAGTFTTTLTVRDKNGCTSIKTQEIRAGSEGGLTVTPSKTKICTGESVSFTQTTQPFAQTWNWNFGNGITSADENPSPVLYNQPGIYNVVVRAKLLGKACESVVSFPIEVVAYPQPSFTYSVDCTQKVTFKNTSVGATSVRWEIDGVYAGDQNTFTRSYQGPGGHQVRLIAYNSLGCSTTIDNTIDVNGKPTAAFLPDKLQDCGNYTLSGCAPFTIDFTNTSASATSYTSKWTFGDGSTATTQNATHTYGVGTYTVTLDIKNAQGCTATRSATVIVSNKMPQAKFTIQKNTACTREDIKFNNESTDGTFFCWDFGDGTTSNDASPAHSYTEPGTYTVTLIAKNGGCSSTYIQTNIITVNNPFVDFEIKKSCSDPFAVQLINKSTNYTGLTWNFGNGQTATGNLSSYRYTTTGDYKITLTGTNSATQCSVPVAKQVTIYDVTADFTVDNLRPCKGSPVTFTDKSTGAVAWTWFYGNGIVESRQNGVAYYENGIKYTATLSASDPDGCSDSKSVIIDVLNIDGKFTSTATSDCSSFKVSFTDQSSPNITDWVWNFGDGSPLVYEKDPIHTYTTLGKYNVAITVTNNEGTCTAIKSEAVNFTVPIPAIAVSRNKACLNEELQFASRSQNATSYIWEFSTGETSTQQNPIKSFNAVGKYGVVLRARDSYGCTHSVTDSITIAQPIAAFTGKNLILDCPRRTDTEFINNSIGAVQWEWNFGDGQSSIQKTPLIRYMYAGVYDVTLTVTNDAGCKDMLVQPKMVSVDGPGGKFSVLGDGPFCVNDSTLFVAETTNTAFHRWDFADGNVRDYEDMNAGHRYKNPGQYNVTLVLYDGKGCDLAADGKAVIEVMDTTKIDFNFPPCVFTDIASPFTATAEQNNLTYTWTIDGELAGTGPEIPVNLNTPGKHTIILDAINAAGCVSTIVYDVPVQGDVIKVPNVFTPNDLDNINSTFEIVGLERSTWDLTIYNRWGKEVFEQRTYNNNWTGHGLSTGVYFYSLKNTICPAKEYKGMVSIAR